MSSNLLDEISKLNDLETLEELLDQQERIRHSSSRSNSLENEIIIHNNTAIGIGNQQQQDELRKSGSIGPILVPDEDEEDGLMKKKKQQEELRPIISPQPSEDVKPLLVNALSFQEELHRCPTSNVDITVCDFCKIINILSLVNRNFKLRGESDIAQLVQECSIHVKNLRGLIDQMTPHLHRFDFDEHVKANGHRTWVQMTKCGVAKCLYLVNEIYDKSRFCTVASHPDLFERLLDWSRIFRVKSVVMECLVDFIAQAKTDSLFTSSREATDKLISMSKERVNLVGFHGKLLGFQFCKSVRIPLRIVSTLMGAYSEIYKSEGFFKSSLLSSKAFIYYWLSPSERAERIAKICSEDPLTFFKEFWLIQETGLVRIVSNCLGESCDANVEISIPPVRINVRTNSKKLLTILPPSEYTGIKPIMVRLISHKVRNGAVGSGVHTTHESMSKTLIIHCHGGGFVAQSSNSHLVYLKSFSRGSGAPILSVDYSLSPEAPYPRALHEAFYAYLWALEHAHILGSTAEKVILTGDSAGGLILTGVTILCIEFGIRIPDGLLLVYTPQLLESAISPARLLSLADPLIPYPALAACLGAYLGKTFDPSVAQLPGCFVDGPWEPEEFQNSEVLCSRRFMSVALEELDGVNVPQDDWHLSPLIAPDHILARFPPTSIVTTVFDPCMDDCISFGKRLKDLNIKTTMDILDHLPHGFLNFGRVSEECFRGIEVCFRRLKEFVN